MGTSSFAVPCMKGLLNIGENLIGVFTQPDRPQGRGLKIKISPIKALALEHSIPIFQPEKINKEESLEIIKSLSPDLIVVAAFGQILSQRILNLTKKGAINVHASLLPKYRGAAPINWAIIQGEKETGITTMLMDNGLDTGDILMQRKIDILPEENAGSLHDRLVQLGAETMIETIGKWKKGELTPQKQDESRASYAPSLKKEDGLIDWGKPAEMIHNQVRGMNPWPGAYTYLEGKNLRVFQVKAIMKESHKDPGTVLKISDEGILVSTGDNRLLLTEIQLENHKRMPADQFLRGHPIPVGTQFSKFSDSFFISHP